MSQYGDKQSELWELLEALGEDRMTPAQESRLEQLVLGDAEARRTYLDYIHLHGALYWDTANAADGLDRITPPPRVTNSRPAEPASVGLAGDRPAPGRRRTRLFGWATLAASVLAAAVLLLNNRFSEHVVPAEGTARTESASTALPRQHQHTAPLKAHAVQTPPERPVARSGVDGSSGSQTALSRRAVEAPVPEGRLQQGRLVEWPVALINQQVEAGWTLAGIEPSPAADDAEWIRRAYLDIIGRIPTAEAVRRFVDNDDPGKRAALIEELLADPGYVENWTTVWTNLLIGRSESRDVNRPALRRFLRKAFAQNRPWDEIVFELVSAEGDADKNGAANFLLAHLNNQAVPATAITARLFLGMQVQCTQCHHHPFNKWKQEQFWELNSFFQQTQVVRKQQVDPRTGQRERVVRLESKPQGGPIFYEDRRGVMKAALPAFAGVRVSDEPNVDRRRELARLMIEGETTQVARAMVNRMWAHFFGYGFTRPVDDMGPHNAPTHPALLEGLARKFVESGYDLKQLIRWICTSRPYQLTSRLGPSNEADDPASGLPPLFSRMYVRPMTAEQIYDSLLLATKADQAGHAYWNQAQRRREKWLKQFVVVFQTEENDEMTLLDGTVPQALELMNGELIRQAVSAQPGTYLHEVATARVDDNEKIRRLFLAALSRYPSPEELAACRKLLRDRTAGLRGPDRQTAHLHALQDLFWAALNSSEFVLVH